MNFTKKVNKENTKKDKALSVVVKPNEDLGIYINNWLNK